MSFSVADVIASLLPSLNATSGADLAFWSLDDLYAYADEAAKRLARTALLFVVRDTSTAVIAYPIYSNPPNHVELLAMTAGGVWLAPSSSRELAALSATWLSDTGPPVKWIADWLGHDLFRLYPTPTLALVGNSVEVILAVYPPDISAGAPTVTAPLVVGDYLAHRVIAEARRKEGDGAMLDVADNFDQRATLYEQIFTEYWGPSQ